MTYVGTEAVALVEQLREMLQRDQFSAVQRQSLKAALNAEFRPEEKDEPDA